MIDEDVFRAVKDFQKQTSDDDSLQKLRVFYEEMKRLGVAQTHEYDLPPVDTIGVTAYRRESGE